MVYCCVLLRQLEHLRDDETLNLFKRIVELSRSLSSYQDIIVSNADKELKRGQQALEGICCCSYQIYHLIEAC